MRTAAQPHLRSRMSPIPSKTYFSVAAEFYECFRAASCCSQAGAGRNAVRKTARAAASPLRRPATHFMFVCALRRLLPVRLAELHCHAVLCCSPAAEDVHEPAASCSPPQWGGGELRDSASRNIHMRQPHPRQKRFRIKGGRGDGALRIGDFLILKNAKHPIQRRRCGRPRNRFTAAVFRLPFVRTKGNG